MGIKNLFSLIKPFCKDANLADFAGKTAAIDASCWIHRALAISVSESGNRDRLESIFLKHLTVVKSAGITLFVVFDGSPLPAKANEAAKRQRTRDEALRRAELGDGQDCNKLRSQGISISFQDISTCIKICLKETVRYIVSPYESDAQIAFLLKHGHADLTYGCKEIFVKVKLSGTGSYFILEEILDGLKLSFGQFQKMCVAAGCDYLENVKGVGIQRAYALVCGNNLLDDLVQKGAPTGYKDRFSEALAVFNHQTVFSVDQVKCVPLNEWNRQVSDEMQHFCGILLDDTLSINLASGNVDPRSGVKVNSHSIQQVEHYGVFPSALVLHSQALTQSGLHLLHGSINVVGLSADWLQRHKLENFLLN